MVSGNASRQLPPASVNESSQFHHFVSDRPEKFRRPLVALKSVGYKIATVPSSGQKQPHSTLSFRTEGYAIMKQQRTWRAAKLAILTAALLPASSAFAQLDLIVDLVVDGGNTYNWQKVALPGTVCGNGSQYKFWYYDSPTSNNMVVLFEGGGACWDYDTCSGRAGSLGASNPNGLADTYMTGMEPKYVSPIINGADPGLPFRSKDYIATNGW